MLDIDIESDLSGSCDIVSNYEQKLRQYFKSDYSLATSSGTSALILALAALNIKVGDSVIMTPTCPLCTVYPVLSTGAEVLFCDTQKETFSIDLKDAQKIISSNVKAIIDIPMWGYPIPALEIREFSLHYNIPLIFDLAHSHGTIYNDMHLSAYCDIACFSTHFSKIISTGEGGFLLTNNELFYDKAMKYSRFGTLNGEDFGLNYKLSGLQAFVGIKKLDVLDENLRIRRQYSESIVDNISNSSIQNFNIIEGGIPNYYRLLLRTYDENMDFIDYLDSCEILTDIKRYRIKALYEYPILKDYKRSCPNAEKLLKSIATITIHPEMTSDNLSYIIDTINRYRI